MLLRRHAERLTDSKGSHGVPVMIMNSLGKQPLLCAEPCAPEGDRPREEPLTCVPQPVCASHYSEQVPAFDPQDKPQETATVVTPF